MTLLQQLSHQRTTLAKDKKSLICAWLDPAPYILWRWNKWLLAGIDTSDKLHTRCKAYIDAVCPYVTGLKYNQKYREGEDHINIITSLVTYARNLWLFIIEDGKIADIGSTNDAWFHYAVQRWAHCATLAPYAGNMATSIHDATQRNLGIFTMCLMSNPAYKQEKNILVPYEKAPTAFQEQDIIRYWSWAYVHRYVFLAQQANEHNALGVVIWAPSQDNHISCKEIERVASYLSAKQLILCPGTGAQWWHPKDLISLFGERNIIALSRGLMFAQGSKTSPQEQAQAAKYWRDEINKHT